MLVVCVFVSHSVTVVVGWTTLGVSMFLCVRKFGGMLMCWCVLERLACYLVFVCVSPYQPAVSNLWINKRHRFA